MATEQTIIRVLNLPAGRDWVWIADCNVIGLSSRLDEAGRQRALDEMQDQWRRKCLRMIGTAATSVTAAMAVAAAYLPPTAGMI